METDTMKAWSIVNIANANDKQLVLRVTLDMFNMFSSCQQSARPHGSLRAERPLREYMDVIYVRCDRAARVHG